MFDPTKSKAAQAEKAKKKKILAELVNWATSVVPEVNREGLLVDVKEVQCGDPDCSPIDTIFTLVWKDGGRGMFALPLSSEEITQDDLIENFPDDITLMKWSKGEKASWPPRPQLRFEIGERVECRIGPHPVKGWAAGRVIKHFYSEPNWPPNMVAPYQIALHDGRLIFAPADNDNVIRRRAPAAEGDPPSPEFHPADDGDDDDYPDDYGDDEEDYGGEGEGDGEGEEGGDVEEEEGVTMTHDDDLEEESRRMEAESKPKPKPSPTVKESSDR
jgi:hypothetical protein